VYRTCRRKCGTWKDLNRVRKNFWIKNVYFLTTSIDHALIRKGKFFATIRFVNRGEFRIEHFLLKSIIRSNTCKKNSKVEQTTFLTTTKKHFYLWPKYIFLKNKVLQTREFTQNFMISDEIVFRGDQITSWSWESWHRDRDQGRPAHGRADTGRKRWRCSTST